MLKYCSLFLFIVLISCGESRDCSFDSLDNAVNCACEIINEKEAAKGDKEIIEQLKEQTNGLNDSFEKALKDSTFTEKEFVEKLKSTCENF
jgi:hypothetical protein